MTSYKEEFDQRRIIHKLTKKPKRKTSVHVWLQTICGHILFGHNEKYDNLSHPGGWVEPDETIFEALMREFFEETHIKFPDVFTTVGLLSRTVNDVTHHHLIVKTTMTSAAILRQRSRNEPNIPDIKDYRENKGLVFVPLDELTRYATSKEDLGNEHHFVAPIRSQALDSLMLALRILRPGCLP